MFRVSFTGYRPEKLPFFGEDDPLFIDFMKRLRDKISELIADGAEVFISGMALGSDTFCAETVLELKKEHPSVKLIAAIPCADQASRWSEKQQEHYRELLEKCDKREVLAEHYYRGCMQRRNRYLVDNCDVLFAIFDGKSGGTKNTVDYANRVGRKVILLPPI